LIAKLIQNKISKNYAPNMLIFYCPYYISKFSILEKCYSRDFTKFN
jgi:hypothetical protein